MAVKEIPSAQSRRRSRYRRRRNIRRGWLLAALLCLVLGLCLIRWAAAKEDTISGEAPQVSGPASSVPASSAPQSAGPASSETPESPAAASVPRGTDILLSGQDFHTGTLVLVNNEIPYIFPEEEELLCVLENKNRSYLVKDGTVFLRPEALDALNRMMADFAAQGGPRTLNVVAGHRTRDFQQHLFDQSAAANGLEHARRYVAQPGYSEHHTGYALDLSLYFSNGTSRNFDGTGDYRWIADHAADYGFVLRYPDGKEDVTGIAYESWHYRYVGVPHAAIIAERGLCLEEYVELLQSYPYEGEHLETEAGGTRYEIYTCVPDALCVPSDAPYTVSGDNVSGFIVTVERK